MSKSMPLVFFLWALLSAAPVQASPKDLLRNLVLHCLGRTGSPSANLPTPEAIEPLNIDELTSMVTDYVTMAGNSIMDVSEGWNPAVLLLANSDRGYQVYPALRLMTLIVERSKENWVALNQRRGNSKFVGQNVLSILRRLANDRNKHARTYVAILLRHWAHIKEAQQTLAELKSDSSGTVRSASSEAPVAYSPPNLPEDSFNAELLARHPEYRLEPGLLKTLTESTSYDFSSPHSIYHVFNGRNGRAVVRINNRGEMSVEILKSSPTMLNRLIQRINNGPLTELDRAQLSDWLNQTNISNIHLQKRNREVFVSFLVDSIRE